MSEDLNPYETPKADLDGLRAPYLVPKQFMMMNTGLYAKIAIVCLAVFVVMSFISAIIYYVLIQRYGYDISYMKEKGGHSALFNNVGSTWFSSFFLSLVFVALWKYRSMNNAWVFRKMKILPTVSKGWSIGWYFIPIANFWKPYEAMTEIMINTVGELKHKALFRIWWLAWIMGVLPFFITFSGGMRMNTFELYRDVWFDVCIGFSALLLMIIISMINKAQTAEIKARMDERNKDEYHLF